QRGRLGGGAAPPAVASHPARAQRHQPCSSGAVARRVRMAVMRVLFASWAGGGHFAPLAPIGWALRAAGHEVFVAGQPSGAAAIVQSGLPALPVGPDVDMFEVLRTRRAGSHERGYPGMLATAEAIADGLADDLVAF